MRDGQGKQTEADGSNYDGGWKNNKREGKGKLQKEDGTKYDGDFH